MRVWETISPWSWSLIIFIIKFILLFINSNCMKHSVVFSLKYLFLVFTMLMSNFIANISFMGTGVGTWPQHATERGHMTTTTTTTTQALQCPISSEYHFCCQLNSKTWFQSSRLIISEKLFLCLFLAKLVRNCRF